MNDDPACLCAEDFDVVRGDSEFLPASGLELIAKHPAGWKDLYRCPNCGQHWQVDRWDQGQVGLAIKVADPLAWEALDDMPWRRIGRALSVALLWSAQSERPRVLLGARFQHHGNPHLIPRRLAGA
jgi:hypothetical protein